MSTVTKSKLAQLYEAGATDARSGVGKLAAIGKELGDQVDDRLSLGMDFVDAVTEHLDDSAQSVVDSPALAGLYQHLSTERDQLNINSQDRLVRVYSADDTIVMVSPTGQEVTIAEWTHEGNLFNLLPEVPEGETLETVLTTDWPTYASDLREAINGVLPTQELANLCDTLAQTPSAFLANTNEAFSDSNGAIASCVNNMQHVPQGWKAQLLAGLKTGPAGMAQTVAQLYKGHDNSVTAWASGASYTIEYASLAPGIILSAIGQVITTAGAIAFAASRVLGAVLSAVGLVTTAVTKVVSNVVEAAAGTNFTIHSGEARFFDFAVGAGEYTTNFDPADWDLPDCFTIINKRSAVVSLCQVTNRNGGVITIYEEDHLSCDYTFIDAIVASGNTMALDGLTIVDFQNTAAKVTADFGFERTDTLAGNYLKPLDLGVFNRLKDFYTDELKGEMSRRLATALTLWGWNVLLMRKSDGAGDATPWRTYTSLSEYAPITAFYAPYAAYHAGNSTPCNAAIGCLASGLAFWAKSMIASAPDVAYTDQWTDDLLVTVAYFFNGLRYDQGSITLTGILFEYDEDGTVGNTYYMTGFNSTDGVADAIAENQPTTTQNRILLSKLKVTDNMIILMSRLELVADVDLIMLRCMPTAAGVSLPSSLWSAFIAGIIVDSLIVVTAVVATILSLVVTARLRTRSAKLSAQSEAWWYQYQDDVKKYGADSDQAAVSWKKYKRTRLKYSIMSGLFGSSTADWSNGATTGAIDDAAVAATTSLASLADVSRSVGSLTTDVSDIERSVQDVSLLITG